MFFENLIFAAARSKVKVNRLATGELVGCPLFGSLLTPKSGQPINSPGGQPINYNLALCFAIFQTNFCFGKNRKLIESQLGTSVAKLIAF